MLSSGGNASIRLAKITQILNKWKNYHRGYSSLSMSQPPSHVRVPAGCIPIYVGSAEEEKMGIAKAIYILKIKELNHPLLQSLLRRAEEESGGFQYEGGPLTIPCHSSVFESLLRQTRHVNAGATNRCRLATRPFLIDSIHSATTAF
jgi:hypothetical protein